MKIAGYLDHLDLGIDPESGTPCVLVRSAEEFFQLPDDQQYRAWSVIKVASEILEKPTITIYQQAYGGKIPSKIIKKNPWDRRGLTVVKVYTSLKDREARRAEDRHRIVKALKRATWLPPAQRALIGVLVSVELTNIERELFGREARKGNRQIKEGNHETIAA